MIVILVFSITSITGWSSSSLFNTNLITKIFTVISILKNLFHSISISEFNEAERSSLVGE